jgi:hypothetical protein
MLPCSAGEAEIGQLTFVQELGSMYDYLAKIILLGPSGCGKYGAPNQSMAHMLTIPFRSCLLHRFVKDECMTSRVLRHEEYIVNIV